MLVDFHTHCFPDKLSHRALEKISFDAGGLEYYTEGTFDSLKAYMDRSGTDIAVALNIATNPHQQTSVNNFAASINQDPRIYAFGSVHPDAPNALEELERIKALGLKGVKFHPEYQSFFVDEPRMKPIYKKISQLGLLTVFHAGADHGFTADCNCPPQALAHALTWFDTPVVAAHWGGLFRGEEVLRFLSDTPVYIDVSLGYSCILRSTALRITERFGTKRMVFGTDSPWHYAGLEMRLLNTLQLSPEEMADIRYKTAFRLLELPPLSSDAAAQV